jgi:undecaprenyl-diphosphatase
MKRGGVIIISSINNWDQNIINYIYNNLRNPFFDEIMKFITIVGNGGAIWFIICLLLIISKKYRKVGVVALIVLAFNAILGEFFLKNLIGRVRPYAALDLKIMIKELGSFSMPSVHTLCSFSVAFVVLFLVRDWRIYVPILVLAILISISRVYLCVHYPTDILLGVVIAFVVSVIIIKIAKYMNYIKGKY